MGRPFCGDQYPALCLQFSRENIISRGHSRLCSLNHDGYPLRPLLDFIDTESATIAGIYAPCIYCLPLYVAYIVHRTLIKPKKMNDSNGISILIMLKTMRYTLLILGLLSYIGCASPANPPLADAAFEADFSAWQQTRLATLTGENGWLNLEGLYWFEPGSYSFGSAETNDLVFPAALPDQIGTFVFEGDSIWVTIAPGVNVLHKGEPVHTLTMRSDTTGEATVLTYGTYQWYVIDRDHRTGIRLRNLDSEHAKQFPGVETYALDSTWRVDAILEPFDTLRTISVPTILGTVRPNKSPGRLAFSLKDQSLHLTPVLSEGKLFLIFADQTTGQYTYGGGRFMYAALPDSTGHTVIDFNRAYNPPCAFSAYSTCPQPPPENRLPISITAGEKMYKKPITE